MASSRRIEPGGKRLEPDVEGLNLVTGGLNLVAMGHNDLNDIDLGACMGEERRNTSAWRWSNRMARHRGAVLTGVREGLPIFIGYFPIAIAFGLLAKSAALSFLEAGMFSAFVFAGASQFIAVSLLAAGVGLPSIVVTTFLINSRHLLLSAAVAARLEGTRRWVPLAAYGVTDETFAVATTRKDSYGTPYLLGLNTTAWLGWLSGTLAGYVAGGLLPARLQTTMGLLLYVMFLGILMPQVRRELRVLLVAGLSGLLHWGLRMLGWLPDGWSLVAAIVLSVLVVDGLKGRHAENGRAA